MSRNVFVSYAHRLDYQLAKDFRERFSLNKMVFSDRSLGDNEFIRYLSYETIKRNYISSKIKNSSVTIILIGAETGKRWWVDWEIYHSLRKSSNNERNGLLGIKIPNKSHSIPSRLMENLNMGKIIDMPRDYRTLDNAIEEVYNKRFQQPDLSAPLRQRNS